AAAAAAASGGAEGAPAVPPRPRRVSRGAAPPGKAVAMDFAKLTISSQQAVAAAQETARRNGNPQIYPEHLLLALLDQELPRELLSRSGAGEAGTSALGHAPSSLRMSDAAALRAQAEAALAQKPRIEGSQQQPGVSAAFAKVLDRAADE